MHHILSAEHKVHDNDDDGILIMLEYCSSFVLWPQNGIAN